jgi:hypothetical protein
VQQVVALVVHTTVALLEAMAVAAAVLVDNGITNTDQVVQDLQPILVVLDHKVVMELVDTQEQVVVAVPHLELLVTLV